MVADIRLLQGKVIDDLDLYPKNFTLLMEELALELIEDQNLNPSGMTLKSSTMKPEQEKL